MNPEMKQKKDALLLKLTKEEICRMDKSLAILHQEIIDQILRVKSMEREFETLRLVHEQLTRIVDLAEMDE